eukprot:15476026-Alexandrium_andersonii.AAC.2
MYGPAAADVGGLSRIRGLHLCRSSPPNSSAGVGRPSASRSSPLVELRQSPATFAAVPDLRHGSRQLTNRAPSCFHFEPRCRRVHGAWRVRGLLRALVARPAPCLGTFGLGRADVWLFFRGRLRNRWRKRVRETKSHPPFCYALAVAVAHLLLLLLLLLQLPALLPVRSPARELPPRKCVWGAIQGAKAWRKGFRVAARRSCAIGGGKCPACFRLAGFAVDQRAVAGPVVVPTKWALW